MPELETTAADAPETTDQIIDTGDTPEVVGDDSVLGQIDSAMGFSADADNEPSAVTDPGDEDDGDAADTDKPGKDASKAKDGPEDGVDPIRSLDPAYVARALKSGMTMSEVRSLAKDDPEYLVALVENLSRPGSDASEKKPQKQDWGKALVEKAMSNLGDDYDEDQKDSLRKSFEAIVSGVGEKFGEQTARQTSQKQREELVAFVERSDSYLEKIDPKGELYGKGSTMSGEVGKRATAKRNRLYTLANRIIADDRSMGFQTSHAEAIQMAHAAINHKTLGEKTRAETRDAIRQTAQKRDRSAMPPASHKPVGGVKKGSNDEVLSELQSILPG